MPNLNMEDNTTVPGYINSFMIAKVLTACGDNLTRENILKQATSLQGRRCSDAAVRHHPQQLA